MDLLGFSETQRVKGLGRRVVLKVAVNKGPWGMHSLQGRHYEDNPLVGLSFFHDGELNGMENAK